MSCGLRNYTRVNDMTKSINISPFLNESGKITQLPSKQKTRLAVLEYLAEKFEPEVDYTEQQVNCTCNEWHTFGDFYRIRRELIDNGLLCRERDGSRYWREVKK